MTKETDNERRDLVYSIKKFLELCDDYGELANVINDAIYRLTEDNLTNKNIHRIIVTDLKKLLTKKRYWVRNIK